MDKAHGAPTLEVKSTKEWNGYDKGSGKQHEGPRLAPDTIPIRSAGQST